MDLELLWKAFILGVVEGVTEYLPVSSTGHLIVIGKAIGFEPAFAETFEIFIQLGGILAVLVLYWRRFRDFVPGVGGFGLWAGWPGILRMGVTSAPALVLGALLHGKIKEHLFTPTSVAVALLVGAVVMFVVERFPKGVTVDRLERVTLKQCFLIGACQCFALWPGMSRSGSTIVGGMLLGLERRVAAEFSFLVAVPIMCAAVGYDLLKSFGTLSVDALPVFGVGFVVSFLCALVAIKFLIAVLGKYSLVPFAWYRVGLAGVVLWWAQG